MYGFTFNVILYEVERYISMLFIDDKDSVKHFSVGVDLHFM